MKLSNILFGFALVLAVILGFVLLFQKQHNEHTEKMVVQLNDLPTDQPCITLPVVQEQKTKGQKIKETVQSTIAFVAGIFSKF